MSCALARACANVALAKYWGKRDDKLNLPYTGSLSVTLAGLTTTARVAPAARQAVDSVLMNGAAAPHQEAQRISTFLDLVRQRASRRMPLAVEIDTSFPVAAGIASSASTFAALAVATAAACDLALSPTELSIVARLGSGSAARSIHGGYVEWLPGEISDGSDSFATPIASADHWPLGVVVAITHEGKKDVGSREGMARAVKQSPFFSAWLASHEDDLDDIRRGILARDIEAVGLAAEHNCLKMHAVALAAKPPLFYWKPATLAVIERVRQLRDEGLSCYFTIDAGPQVKVICPIDQRDEVAAALGRVPGVHRTLLSEPGPDAELLEVK